jgi:branched-chain amino acid aminotransferase
MSICWLNGQIMPTAEAMIPVQDHGLLYGDGIFEGIRFYHRRPFRLQAHLDRLWLSARAIDLMIPETPEQISAAVDEVVAVQSSDDGYLRLVVTRGTGPLGLDPRRCSRPNIFIIADRLALVPSEVADRGLAVIIASTRRLGPDGLDPRIKSLNYLNHILARQEANRAQADEAILLNVQGRVTEGSADNVFVVKAGQLMTPPVIDGALDGITRGVVLELARALKIPAAEISLSTFDLHTADECFLTGTGAELLPVRTIDGRAVSACPGPLFRRLREAYRTLILAESIHSQ